MTLTWTRENSVHGFHEASRGQLRRRVVASADSR
jgi:hypothetical protein